MRIHYSYRAQKWLEASPAQLQDRITEKLEFYASQEKPYFFVKKLIGDQTHRFRVGNYRIICDINDDLIDVLYIERRDRAYKRKTYY